MALSENDVFFCTGSANELKAQVRNGCIIEGYNGLGVKPQQGRQLHIIFYSLFLPATTIYTSTKIVFLNQRFG